MSNSKLIDRIALLVFAALLLNYLPIHIAFANELQTNEETNPAIQVNSINIAPNTPLYSDAQFTKQVGIWQATTALVAFEQLVDNEYAIIEIAGKSYYVPFEYITPSEQLQETESAEVIGFIETEKTYSILAQPSNDSEVLLQGTEAVVIDVLAIEWNYYVVQIAGNIAYVPMADTTLTGVKFVVAADNTPFKDVTGKQIGTLNKGTVVLATKVTAKYVIVVLNKETFLIPVNSVLMTKAKVSVSPIVKAPFPTTLVSEVQTSFFNQDGYSIGILSKGSKVKLLNVDNGYGIIQLLGGTVKVKLSDFLHIDQVTPNKNISYAEMVYHLHVFSMLYPEFTELEAFGQSVEKRKLYALRVGNGKKEILMDASIHAREHMTTNVLLEMIDQYTVHYMRGLKFQGYNVKSLLNSTSIWFVPMMNPDGVTLVQSGINAVNNSALVKKINQSTNYSRWKANIRGVDLNRNFEGGWAAKKTAKAPSYKNYKGPKVFSEPESQSLRDFVAKHKFKSYISYHSSGQVLYWFHFQGKQALQRDKALAQQISKITGYKLMAPLNEKGSGASADWFIQNYKMPGITVEIAPFSGEGPVPLSYWNGIWKKNASIGLLAATEANKR